MVNRIGLRGISETGKMSETSWQGDPIRCPYCVQGYEFRLMTELTGGTGAMFYCPACRHLVRTAEPDFQCFCRGCLNLRRPIFALQGGHAPSVGRKGSMADVKHGRNVLTRSTSD